jgi:hydrogenase maturation protease
MRTKPPLVLLIGLGNERRGDDAAGLAAVRRIARERPEGVEILECESDCAELLDAWRGATRVFVADALASGAAPGSVQRFDAAAAPLPAARFAPSTHAFGLAQAIELARALGELPPALVVYGIEGRSFDAGAPLSPEVEAGVERAAALLLDEIREARTRHAAQDGTCTNTP